MQQFKKIRNIHFIGIGGSGMIGIATILHKKGYNISGSDISKTTIMNNLNAKEVAPGIDVTNDAELEKFLKATALSVYHPVGTCKMGLDSTSVVDPELRVHGVEGLRVADASILPQLISGNTNAICNVIGVKCADMVEQN